MKSKFKKSIITNQLCRNFVDCLISFSKPIVAVVQGPAVGVGVTMLPHCDVIIASSKATFHTPFSSIGIVPEACSSVTFANIMGSSLVCFSSFIMFFGKYAMLVNKYMQSFFSNN